MLIKEGLRESAVLGVDETGLRVRGRQDWVHVSSTGKLTLLVHDRRRGTPAISEIDILPRYIGAVVHDGFSSYHQYRQCRHAQCNAHLLRELNYVIETSKAGWAQEMKVSGCFRTEGGAAEFCRLRSYVSTMKKQGHRVMETIRSLFAGKVLMPALSC